MIAATTAAAVAKRDVTRRAVGAMPAPRRIGCSTKRYDDAATTSVTRDANARAAASRSRCARDSSSTT